MLLDSRTHCLYLLSAIVLDDPHPILYVLLLRVFVAIVGLSLVFESTFIQRIGNGMPRYECLPERVAFDVVPEHALLLWIVGRVGAVLDDPVDRLIQLLAEPASQPVWLVPGLDLEVPVLAVVEFLLVDGRRVERILKVPPRHVEPITLQGVLSFHDSSFPMKNLLKLRLMIVILHRAHRTSGLLVRLRVAQATWDRRH